MPCSGYIKRLKEDKSQPMEQFKFEKVKNDWDQHTLEGILGMLVNNIEHIAYGFTLEGKKYEMRYDSTQKAYLLKEIKERFIVKNIKYKKMVVKK
jgi:hypothetical protein